MSGSAPALAMPLGLLTPAAFRTPRHFASSTWTGHAPFAYWLIDVLRPRLTVELGTFHGMSFLAFCQAMVESGVDGEVVGVDTWQGDAHVGGIAGDVLDVLQARVTAEYGGFARLVQATFETAAADVAPGSVDLLHIDGFHTYEAVRHDFETWQDKLAPCAVVLFHDTEVRAGDFGVYRFWAEVTRDRPHFSFAHQYGLGVLGCGDAFPPRLEALFGCTPGDATQVRAAFERLGRAVVLEEEAYNFSQDRTAQIALRLRNGIKRRLENLPWPGGKPTRDRVKS